MKGDKILIKTQVLFFMRHVLNLLLRIFNIFEKEIHETAVTDIYI